MKTSLRSASWLLIAFSPLAYLACTDDASIGTTTLNLPDGSVSPTIDAATPIDASTEDAADAAPTTVTITAIKESTRAPEPGASVVFYDAAGAVIGTAVTDANGAATHEIGADGQVTVVFGSATSPRIVTIQGVQPGDALTALDEDRPRSLVYRVGVTPPPNAPSGTDHLTVSLGSCTSTVDEGSQAQVYWYCFSPGGASTLVLAARNAEDEALGVSAVADVVLKTDGTVTPVTFADAWATPSAKQTTSVANVPTALANGYNSAYVSVTHMLGRGNDALLSVNGRGLRADESTYSADFPLPVASPTFREDEVAITEYSNQAPFGLSKRSVTVRGSAAASSVALDLASALPRITAASITGTAPPAVTFTTEAALTTTKATVTQVLWSIPVVDAPYGNGSWLVVSPPTTSTTTKVTPAALPAALAAFGPTDPERYDTPVVAAFEGTMLPSYASARAGGALLTPTRGIQSGSSTLAPILPVDGTLKLSAYALSSD